MGYLLVSHCRAARLERRGHFDSSLASGLGGHSPSRSSFSITASVTHWARFFSRASAAASAMEAAGSLTRTYLNGLRAGFSFAIRAILPRPITRANAVCVTFDNHPQYSVIEWI